MIDCGFLCLIWLDCFFSYAAQGTMNVLSLFTKTGMLISQWGSGVLQEGAQLSLANPKGLALNEQDGTIYVADIGHHRVVALQVC